MVLFSQVACTLEQWTSEKIHADQVRINFVNLERPGRCPAYKTAVAAVKSKSIAVGRPFTNAFIREHDRWPPYTYNVLSGMKHPELLKDVDNFAQQHNLADKRSILQTGALLAQDPFVYDQITTLKASSPGVYDSLYTPTIRDVQAWRDEISNPWHHKKQIPRTVVLCSIGAAVQ